MQLLPPPWLVFVEFHHYDIFVYWPFPGKSCSPLWRDFAACLKSNGYARHIKCRASYTLQYEILLSVSHSWYITVISWFNHHTLGKKKLPCGLWGELSFGTSKAEKENTQLTSPWCMLRVMVALTSIYPNCTPNRQKSHWMMWLQISVAVEITNQLCLSCIVNMAGQLSKGSTWACSLPGFDVRTTVRQSEAFQGPMSCDWVD